MLSRVHTGQAISTNGLGLHTQNCKYAEVRCKTLAINHTATLASILSVNKFT